VIELIDSAHVGRKFIGDIAFHACSDYTWNNIGSILSPAKPGKWPLKFVSRCRSYDVSVHRMQAVVSVQQSSESTLENTPRHQELPVHQVLGGFRHKQFISATLALALARTPVSTVSRVIS